MVKFSGQPYCLVLHIPFCSIILYCMEQGKGGGGGDKRI